MKLEQKDACNRTSKKTSNESNNMEPIFLEIVLRSTDLQYEGFEGHNEIEERLEEALEKSGSGR